MPNPSPLRVQLAELPNFEGSLPLCCKECKTEAQYRVGRIVVHPDYRLEFSRLDAEAGLRRLAVLDWEQWVYFSGYFLCEHCGSGGPWEFSPAGKLAMAKLMVEQVFHGRKTGVIVGIPALFDGTATRTGFEAEAHIKRKIEADPNNAFLWSRLGNLFLTAEEPERAYPAHRKAVELNPMDVESIHSLGNYWFEKGDLSQAAHYFHQFLRICRKGTWYRPEVKEDLVEHVLKTLFDMSHRTNGEIELFPTPEKVEGPSDPKEPAVLVLRNYDLSKESDRRRLVNVFLHGPTMEPLQRRHGKTTTQRAFANWIAPGKRNPFRKPRR